MIQNCIYQKTKKLICDEIEEAIKNDTIDENNYELYFEQLNLSYYLNYFDYAALVESGYLDEESDDPIKMLILKYVEKIYYA